AKHQKVDITCWQCGANKPLHMADLLRSRSRPGHGPPALVQVNLFEVSHASPLCTIAGEHKPTGHSWGARPRESSVIVSGGCRSGVHRMSKLDLKVLFAGSEILTEFRPGSRSNRPVVVAEVCQFHKRP